MRSVASTRGGGAGRDPRPTTRPGDATGRYRITQTHRTRHAMIHGRGPHALRRVDAHEREGLPACVFTLAHTASFSELFLPLLCTKDFDALVELTLA